MSKYDNYDDEKIIKSIIEGSDKELIDYFFMHKCKSMLTYIAHFVFGNGYYKEVLGEFYVYLSDNNWYVLRQYKKKNNASLNSYLSHCALNYFIAKKKADDKYINYKTMELFDKSDDIYECNDLAKKAIVMAYKMLKTPYQKALDLLVIKKVSALEAADTLWQYTKHKEVDWRTFPVKKVQDTMAMSKRQACFHLSNKTMKILKELEGSDNTIW